ncbi:MAG: MFS transporter [Candidatus Omnitrophica bacterium]|nr:MFS transporter [Candidatus Omnitrophota bacterium]
MTRIQRIESMMAKKSGFVPPTIPTRGGITRLLAAHTASVLADRLVQMAALAVAVASASKAAATSAWILFWATVPAIALAPLAGRAVDRFARTKLMMMTDAARAFLALWFLYVLRQAAGPSALYLGVALVASAACFFTPARLALVPSLIKKEELFKVNGWFAASAMVMTLVGTAIGSLLIHHFGIVQTLQVTAALYFTSAILLRTVTEPSGKSDGNSGSGFWEGFRAIRRHQALRRLVTLAVAISVLEAWFYVGVTKLAVERLHLGILGFGGLMTALGFGLLCGVALAHRYPKTSAAEQSLWLARSLAVIGISCLVLAVVPSFIWAAASMALIGIGTAGCLTASDTLFQRAVPDRTRGRIFSARGFLSSAAFAVCVALAGKIAPLMGISGWFVGTALFTAVIAISVGLQARDMTLLYGIVHVLLRPIAWIYCRPRRIGLDRIPLSGPVLVAPNHPSRLDGALMIAYSRRRLYFLAAETNWNLWWLGWLCTQFGCVPVSRTSGNSNAVHTAAQLLNKGKAVCIFPEGHIYKDLGTLKPGVAILAATTGVPIVPVGFNGTYEAMPPGEGLRRHPVGMAVGEPIRIQKVRMNRVPEEMIERINGELSDEIRRLAGQKAAAQSWDLEEETAESAVYGY